MYKRQDQETDNRALAAALLSIGQHFQMFTVAEAVETLAEAELLRDMGVACMQGFLFGAAPTKPGFDQPPMQKTA